MSDVPTSQPSSQEPTGGDGRHETPQQRHDRNWNELLQELRVLQTGVQVLTGFLLTVPFQARFDRLSDDERSLYVITLLLGVFATVLLASPVSIHRFLFRRHLKGTLVTAGDRMAKAGLAALAATMSCAVLLVVQVTFSLRVALAAAGVVVAAFTLTWLVVPLVLRRGSRRAEIDVGP